MLYKRHIESKDIKLLILDEADEMLSMGFKDLPWYFSIFAWNDASWISATLSPEVMDLTSKFMKNPVNILIKNDEINIRRD